MFSCSHSIPLFSAFTRNICRLSDITPLPFKRILLPSPFMDDETSDVAIRLYLQALENLKPDSNIIPLNVPGNKY